MQRLAMRVYIYIWLRVDKRNVTDAKLSTDAHIIA
jgi:hypothetical protein